MVQQILWGSLVLGICSMVHVAFLVCAIKLLKFLGTTHKFENLAVRIAALLGCALAVIVLAHTVQVWVWAGSLVILGAISDISTSAYFALVTYTTLGYGEITLSEQFRIFGAMAAVTGLLNFGLSTAFVVALFGKILPANLVE